MMTWSAPAKGLRGAPETPRRHGTPPSHWPWRSAYRAKGQRSPYRARPGGLVQSGSGRQRRHSARKSLRPSQLVVRRRPCAGSTRPAKSRRGPTAPLPRRRDCRAAFFVSHSRLLCFTRSIESPVTTICRSPCLCAPDGVLGSVMPLGGVVGPPVDRLKSCRRKPCSARQCRQPLPGRDSARRRRSEWSPASSPRQHSAPRRDSGHTWSVVACHERGLGVKCGSGCRRSGPAGGVVVASSAQVSIAPLTCGDRAEWEARSGGAFPKRAVRRLDENGRLPERRAGCG